LKHWIESCALFLQAENTSTWPEHLKRKMERGEKAGEEEEKEMSFTATRPASGNLTNQLQDSYE